MAESKIEGIDDLRRKLKKLIINTDTRIVASAASYAMAPVVKEARRRAPIGSVAHKTYRGRWVAPGHLSRNVIKRTRRTKDRKGFTVKVGPRKEAFYGSQFVELGKSKDHNQKPNPWLVPAFESQFDTVVERFEKRLKEKIEEAAR